MGNLGDITLQIVIALQSVSGPCPWILPFASARVRKCECGLSTTAPAPALRRQTRRPHRRETRGERRGGGVGRGHHGAGAQGGAGTAEGGEMRSGVSHAHQAHGVFQRLVGPRDRGTGPVPHMHAHTTRSVPGEESLSVTFLYPSQPHFTSLLVLLVLSCRGSSSRARTLGRCCSSSPWGWPSPPSCGNVPPPCCGGDGGKRPSPRPTK